MASRTLVNAPDLTTVSTDLKHALGSIVWEGNKAYKYVNLNNTTATVAGVAGDVVGYGLAGYDDHLVVLDLDDSQTKPIGAGVLLAAVAGVSGTDYYLWVQIKGAATVAESIGGTPADGDKLYLSTTDKTLTIGAAADDPTVAFADDASAKLIVCDFPF